MLINLFLKLNQLFPQPPHPFNTSKGGVFNLNYSDYEFQKAPAIFAKYNRFGDFLELIKDKKIVDFCCGGGGKSIYLALNGAKEVHGIDLNSNFIAQAKNIAIEKGVAKKCFFSVDNVQKSKLPADFFDLIIINDSIEHIPDPKACLLEAKRILKPGGQVYINFEAYYYFFGHHLWDALPIPWLHLFTTEPFRIQLYKKAVAKFPDGQSRIDFRISKDKNGREQISYLNYITIAKFERILKAVAKDGLITEQLYHSTFNKKILKILARLPFLREVFLSTNFYVLRKVSQYDASPSFTKEGVRGR